MTARDTRQAGGGAKITPQPDVSGTVFRQEKCGCTIDGIGNLRDPWRVRYCPKHAAAPEMLRALELALEQLEWAAKKHEIEWDDYHEAMKAARAALVRATGEAP